MSKQFATKLDPQSKYKQFTQATQLDKVMRDYSVIQQNIQEIQSSNKRQEKEVNTLENKCVAAEQKYVEGKKLENLDSEIKKLEYEAVWANISALEKQAQEYEGLLVRRIYVSEFVSVCHV